MEFKAVIVDERGEILKAKESDLLGNLWLWTSVNIDATPNIAIIWDTSTKKIIEITRWKDDFLEWIDPKDMPRAYEIIEDVK